MNRLGRTPLPRSIRRLTRRLAVVWTVLAVLVGSVSPALAGHELESKLEPELEQAIRANPAASYKVIVTVAETRRAQDRHGDQRAVAREIVAAGRAEGRVRGRLALINGLAAEMTGRKILALSRQPAVRTIALDHQVRLLQAATAPPADTATPTPTSTATNTATATGTASATPTSSPTATPTSTSTFSSTATTTGSPTATTTGTATATSSPTGTATETPVPPTDTATPTQTATAVS
ncbi:MAG TPA: hypothetical protein VGL23_15350, partial [Chloroflexota bacterium]